MKSIKTSKDMSDIQHSKSDIHQSQHQKQKYHDIVHSVLEQAKQKGLAAEVTLKVENGLSVTVRLGEVETVEFNQGKALSLTVYHGKKKGTVSTTDISPEALQMSLAAACRIAEYTEEDPFSGLPEKATLATEIPDLDLYHPWEVTPEQAIEYAKTAENAGRTYDKRITNSEGATFTRQSNFGILGNTLGFQQGYSGSRYALYAAVIAEQAGRMQRDQEFTLARDKTDLDSFTSVGESAAKRTLKRLNARKIKTTEAPVIFMADIAGSLFGSFISAISGGNLYRKSSFLLDHLEKPVFPEFMHIEERPHILKGLGSVPFDGEGVATHQQSFIQNGILKSYVLSSYSARKLGLKTTGNAGGVHNLMISHRDLALEALIKKMHRGLIVTEMMGHGANLVTGDYSRGAFGYWVENGEIQYPVEEITIAGNLREIFLHIVDIASDVEKRGNIQTGSVLIERMTIAGA